MKINTQCILSNSFKIKNLFERLCGCYIMRQFVQDGHHVIFALSVLQVHFSHIQCSDLSRSFCSCLVKPAAGSADLKELVGVNLEFQVDLFSQLSIQINITNL